MFPNFIVQKQENQWYERHQRHDMIYALHALNYIKLSSAIPKKICDTGINTNMFLI